MQKFSKPSCFALIFLGLALAACASSAPRVAPAKVNLGGLRPLPQPGPPGIQEQPEAPPGS